MVPFFQFDSFGARLIHSHGPSLQCCLRRGVCGACWCWLIACSWLDGRLNLSYRRVFKSSVTLTFSANRVTPSIRPSSCSFLLACRCCRSFLRSTCLQYCWHSWLIAMPRSFNSIVFRFRMVPELVVPFDRFFRRTFFLANAIGLSFNTLFFYIMLVGTSKSISLLWQ